MHEQQLVAPGHDPGRRSPPCPTESNGKQAAIFSRPVWHVARRRIGCTAHPLGRCDIFAVGIARFVIRPVSPPFALTSDDTLLQLFPSHAASPRSGCAHDRIAATRAERGPAANAHGVVTLPSLGGNGPPAYSSGEGSSENHVDA